MEKEKKCWLRAPPFPTMFTCKQTLLPGKMRIGSFCKRWHLFDGKERLIDYTLLNPFPNDNFLDWTKLEKLNAGKIKISIFERVENIVGKGVNAKAIPFRVVKSWDCVVKN